MKTCNFNFNFLYYFWEVKIIYLDCSKSVYVNSRQFSFYYLIWRKFTELVKHIFYRTFIYPILPNFIKNYCILRELFPNYETCRYKTIYVFVAKDSVKIIESEPLQASLPLIISIGCFWSNKCPVSFNFQLILYIIIRYWMGSSIRRTQSCDLLIFAASILEYTVTSFSAVLLLSQILSLVYSKLMNGSLPV